MLIETGASEAVEANLPDSENLWSIYSIKSTRHTVLCSMYVVLSVIGPCLSRLVHLEWWIATGLSVAGTTFGSNGLPLELWQQHTLPFWQSPKVHLICLEKPLLETTPQFAACCFSFCGIATYSSSKTATWARTGNPTARLLLWWSRHLCYKLFVFQGRL